MSAFSEWFASVDIVKALLHTAAIILIVVGMIGTFLPILPGTTLIFAGAALHFFTLGMGASGLTWWGL
ncbi:MAG: hypothetical protein AAF226_14735, partial [Verrucomicrobiota bacterium]